MRRAAAALALVTALILQAPLLPWHTEAQDTEAWETPEDPRDLLARLDAQVLETQRALTTARRRGDRAAEQQLTEEFNQLQKERHALAPVVERYR